MLLRDRALPRNSLLTQPKSIHTDNICFRSSAFLSSDAVSVSACCQLTSCPHAHRYRSVTFSWWESWRESVGFSTHVHSATWLVQTSDVRSFDESCEITFDRMNLIRPKNNPCKIIAHVHDDYLERELHRSCNEQQHLFSEKGEKQQKNGV